MATPKNTSESSILEFSTQSFSLTQYTIYEHTLLLRLFQNTQQDFHDAISQQREQGRIQFTERETTEQMRHRKVALRQLEPNKAHYSRLRLALKNMEKKTISIPYRKGKNQPVMYGTWPQLFTVSFVREGQREYAVFHVGTQLLRHYLSISMGYHRLDLATYFSFKHFATRQIYRFYYSHFALGKTKLKLQFLARALSVNAHYVSYASVAKNLLEPARKEMEAAYRGLSSEVHFRYQLSPSTDGTDDDVIFTFGNRQDECPSEDRKAELAGFQTRVKIRLTYEWEVKEEVALDLCSRIRLTMIPELDDFFCRKSWFCREMARKQTPLRNKAGYIVRKLSDFLAELERKEF